ncbi:MAG: polysaccharide pyruvyl transferase family protein [Alphaproteobacteria bacterium]
MTEQAFLLLDYLYKNHPDDFKEKFSELYLKEDLPEDIEGFLEEVFAVNKGRHAFYSLADESFGTASTLTRCIHRLEKGLSFPERESIFAEDYILLTLTAFENEINNQTDPEILKWAHDVLQKYFNVVDIEKSNEILKSYQLFQNIHYQPSKKEKASLPFPYRERSPSLLSYEAFYQLASQRKSVRWFQDKKVPRELLEKSIQAGLYAPSACNRQPFKLHIIDCPEELGKITHIPMGTKGYASQIPCFIAIIGDLSAFFHIRDRHLIYIDASLFAMNFILSLETLGLASCVINWPDIPEKDNALKALLDMQDYERGVMFIAVGYPDPDQKVLFSQRRSVKNMIRGHNNLLSKVFIQIDRTNFTNKGAELMLRAIINRLKKLDGYDVHFVFGEGWNVSSEEIHQNDMYQIVSPSSPLFSEPVEKLNAMGFVKQEQVSLILNAAGFAYGDQWGKEKPHSSAPGNQNHPFASKAFKKLNRPKIIYLPQAFGPFETKDAQKKVQMIFEESDLIFARDTLSYQHLTDLFGETEKIKRAPDFTGLFSPSDALASKDLSSILENAALIIPNNKMNTHTDTGSNTYENFLLDLCKEIIKKNKKIVFLNHEGPDDRKIIDRLILKIFEQTGYRQLVILDDLNAHDIKLAIQHADFVISSRFHGVVSALTQAVPVLCTSWSHKYQELMKEYDHLDGCLEINDKQAMIQKVRKLFDQNYIQKLKKKLEQKTKLQKTHIENMWQLVLDELFTIS